MHAIPTFWRGVQFRSRLEARWAAFFTRMGWDWLYEPFDLQGYIPDFILKLHGDVLVEVKPATSSDDPMLREALDKVMRSGWDGYFNWGHPEDELNRDTIAVGACLLPAYGGIAIGLMHEKDDGVNGPEMAIVATCRSCNKTTFCSSIHSYHCRLCGHHDGDGGLIWRDPAATAECERAWLWAGNQVQWKAPRR